MKFQTEIFLKIFFVIFGESSIVFSVYDRISESPRGHPAATAIASPAPFFLAHRYRSAPAVRFGIDENAAVFLVYNCVLGWA